MTLQKNLQQCCTHILGTQIYFSLQETSIVFIDISGKVLFAASLSEPISPSARVVVSNGRYYLANDKFLYEINGTQLTKICELPEPELFTYANNLQCAGTFFYEFDLQQNKFVRDRKQRFVHQFFTFCDQTVSFCPGIGIESVWAAMGIEVTRQPVTDASQNFTEFSFFQNGILGLQNEESVFLLEMVNMTWTITQDKCFRKENIQQYLELNRTGLGISQSKISSLIPEFEEEKIIKYREWERVGKKKMNTEWKELKFQVKSDVKTPKSQNATPSFAKEENKTEPEKVVEKIVHNDEKMVHEFNQIKKMLNISTFLIVGLLVFVIVKK
ncbi:Conserved_hypothetical protein [Hexamita inflata]|uniref:Transmembrane protein n=1 Tax=Hexamita inflata TaxID=28002 RepID=A0AA86P7W3_9EUKA|nr:Conserved hypothetical protein [Hexamita inflata]